MTRNQIIRKIQILETRLNNFAASAPLRFKVETIAELRVLRAMI